MKQLFLVALALAVIVPTAVLAQGGGQSEVCVTDPAGDSGHVGDNTDRTIWDVTMLCVTSEEGLVTFDINHVARDGFLTHIEAHGDTTDVEGGHNTFRWGSCFSHEDITTESGEGYISYQVLASCFPEGTHTLTFQTFWEDDYYIRYEGDTIAPIDFTVTHGEAPEGTFEPATVTRLAGGSRYETAVEVSQFQFPNGASRVTLANANVQVDALPGSQLGGGPILYVPSEGTVPQVVLDEVARLNPREVIVLGGQLAVGDDVVQQVQAQTQHRVS